MSPKSDNHSRDPPTGRPPGSDTDVDVNDNDNVNANANANVDVDVEQRVPFDPSRCSDGENSVMYMLPLSSPSSRSRTHDWKH